MGIDKNKHTLLQSLIMSGRYADLPSNTFAVDEKPLFCERALYSDAFDYVKIGFAEPMLSLPRTRQWKM